MTEKFLKCVEITLKWEGAYVNHSLDPGGETKYGISKRSYPNVDIKNLTLEDAKNIYYMDYWLPSKAEAYNDALALAHFDFSVNSGLGRSAQMLANTQDYVEYNIKRLTWLTKLNTFKTFGTGWTRRVLHVLSTGHTWQAARPWSLNVDNSTSGTDILLRVDPESKKAFLRRAE